MPTITTHHHHIHVSSHTMVNIPEPEQHFPQRLLFGVCRPTLQWRHNECDCVSNHQPHNCLLKRLFGQRSKKTSKFRVTGLCVENSPGTGEFPAQRASYAENVSIWWRHHETTTRPTMSHVQVPQKTIGHPHVWAISLSWLLSLIVHMYTIYVCIYRYRILLKWCW